VLLHARINASLAVKRLHDQETAYLALVEREQEKSERLLLNILPKSIASRLKTEQGIIAELFPEATVLFADIVGFTAFSKNLHPAEVVERLNGIFSGFDALVEKHGVEKIKTIGDAYMLASGVPVPRPDHAQAAAEIALEMLDEITRHNGPGGTQINIRIGINTGPVVAGVIGRKKFAYDMWGDTVNIASRMESQGQPGFIQITGATHALLRDGYRFEERGEIQVKGRGAMTAYFLTGRR
jgi:adenylate cyclase